MSTVISGSSGTVQNNSTRTVSGATNASPIVVQTTAPHGYATNNVVQITGVTGNTAANGTWRVTVIDSTHFSLTGSVGNGAYGGGGTSVDTSLTPAFTIPSDGDARNAASVNVAFEMLADRTQFLAELVNNVQFQTQTFDSSSTYTTGPFQTKALVYGYGGGGGGGGGLQGQSYGSAGAQTTRSAAGGGGGAATPRWIVVTVTPNTTYSIGIGAGGAGGPAATVAMTAGQASGLGGSPSSFGSLVSFRGGGGGFACTANVAVASTTKRVQGGPNINWPSLGVVQTDENTFDTTVSGPLVMAMGSGFGGVGALAQGTGGEGMPALGGGGGGPGGFPGSDDIGYFGGGGGGGGGGGNLGTGTFGGAGGGGGTPLGPIAGSPGGAGTANSGAGGGGGGGGPNYAFSGPAGGAGGAGGSGRVIVMAIYPTAVSAPTITVTSIFPAFAGRLGTGINVRVNGANFVSGCTAAFGAFASPAVTFIDANTLDVVTPTLPVDGAYTVTVTNPSTASASLASAYTAVQCAAWFDATEASSIHLNAGLVETWDDISGNARHVTQGVAGSRPVVAAANINARNVIDFATSRYLANTVSNLTAAANSAYTVMIIGKGGDGCMLALRNTTPYSSSIYFLAAGTFYIHGDGVLAAHNVTTANNSALTNSPTNAFKSIHKFYGGAVDPDNYINGTLRAITSVGTSQAVEAGTTGFSIAAGAVAQFWQGKIGEMFIVPSAVANVYRDAFHAYGLAKWGVAG